MIAVWIVLINYYAITYPFSYEEVMNRKKYAVEVILQDEGFFNEDFLLSLGIKKIKKLYTISDKGAEFIAWLSVISEKKNWREFIFQMIYSKEGLCKNMNDLAKSYLKSDKGGIL